MHIREVISDIRRVLEGNAGERKYLEMRIIDAWAFIDVLVHLQNKEFKVAYSSYINMPEHIKRSIPGNIVDYLIENCG